MIRSTDFLTSASACMFLVPVSGCLVASEAETEPDLGEVTSPVIGGKAATQDQINSAVAILVPADPARICSGILIAPSVVATAAHCMFKDKDDLCTMEYSNYDLTVVAGALDATTASEDQHYEIARMHYRDDFLCSPSSTIGKANDLAILLLKRPVTSLLPAPVLPIDKVKSNLSKSTLVMIGGYGQHDSTAIQAGQLYTAETPYQESNDTEFAAGAASAPDTCGGDSGGPAYLTVDGVRYVVGMTSRQNGMTGGNCSMGSMGGIYTILGNDDYNTWLKTNSDGAYTGSSFISGGADGGVDGGGSGFPGCTCTVGNAPAPSRLGLWLGVGLALLAVKRRQS